MFFEGQPSLSLVSQHFPTLKLFSPSISPIQPAFDHYQSTILNFATVRVHLTTFLTHGKNVIDIVHILQVSNGAECIVISKKFFLSHCTEAMKRRLLLEVKNSFIYLALLKYI